jgi:hypothetical protein
MPKFKHGTTTHQNGGYPRLSVGPQRYRYVHVLVAEAFLRRPLKKDEHVHHIDGDVRNPKWTNLLIVNREIHNAVSNRQYYYLKQKYEQENAAWWAYFDVTGETPKEAKERQDKEVEFDPANL